MAEILFLTLVYPPDSTSTAHLMSEMSLDLGARGHRVTIVTTRPHNNRDAAAEASQPIVRRWGALLGESRYHGIRVFHTMMPQKGPGVWMRLVGWAGFHAIGVLAALMLAPRPGVVFVPSPPLTSGLVAWLLRLVRGAPFVYNVQEIYPDIAVRLGAVRHPAVIRLLSMLESFVYRQASAITVIGPGMLANLLAKGVPPEKILLIPNFVDTDDLRPLAKENAFSLAHGLAGQFVVSYAGNIGPAQGLECILDAAARLRHEPGIQFLVMGDGSYRRQFERLAAERDLPNLLLLPYQPRSLMPEVYATSDLNLIPQARGTGLEALPSKVYRIMAASRSVLAVSEGESDLAQLVSRVGCGVAVEPDDCDGLVEAIRAAAGDRERCRRQGEAGRRYVLSHYSRQAVVTRYDALLRGVAAGQGVVAAS